MHGKLGPFTKTRNEEAVDRVHDCSHRAAWKAVAVKQNARVHDVSFRLSYEPSNCLSVLPAHLDVRKLRSRPLLGQA